VLAVIALGGTALLRRGEPITADSLRDGVRIAARALAPIAASHQVVIGVGDGPQMTALTLQCSGYANVYPLDLLSAGAEGIISYALEQELASLLPPEKSLATVLTMAEVDPRDPAFRNPTRSIGPPYLREEAEHLRATRGWMFKPNGDKWRRVVASPEPKRILELRPIKWLLERNTVVIAEGGAGIPTMRANGRRFSGVECAIDTDLASELLARELEADIFLLLTAADAVYVDWGTTLQRPIRLASPSALSALPIPACSMGSKVNAAVRFATATGRKAAIGSVGEISRILAGEAGTTISPTASGITYGLRSFAHVPRRYTSVPAPQ
jgi:carbamate kinase